MKTLRTLSYLLLAANVLLAIVWAAPYLGAPRSALLSKGESERLAQQYQPEKIRITREVASPPAVISALAPQKIPSSNSAPLAEASSAPLAVSLTDSANSAPISSPQSTSAPVATEAPLPPTPAAEAARADNNQMKACVVYSGLSAEQVATVSQATREVKEKINVREVNATAPEKPQISYWVSIAPLGGKAGAIRRAGELRAAGISEFFVVQEAGANQYAISLGLYRNQASAQRQLESLRRQGITNARIVTRDNNTPSSRVELSASKASIERLRKLLAGRLSSISPASCEP